MFPHERSLVKQLADKPFVMIGVNSDPDIKVARKSVKEKNLPWRSFWNGKLGTSGPISTKWSIGMWPTVYVIDAKGTIRYKGEGSEVGEELDEAITKALADAGHEVELTHESEKKDAVEEAE